MKYLIPILILFLFLLAPTSASAQPPVAADSSLAWDYPDTSVTSGGVVRFETAYLAISQGQDLSMVDQDTLMWTDAGMVPLPGSQEVYYQPLPPVLTGWTGAFVRACNSDDCSEDNPALSFRVGVVPDAPPGFLRIVPTPAN